MGWKLRRRLNDEGLNTCSDLWPLSAAHLQKGLGLGEKTGQALWEACRGIDKRPVQVRDGNIKGRSRTRLCRLWDHRMRLVCIHTVDGCADGAGMLRDNA